MEPADSKFFSHKNSSSNPIFSEVWFPAIKIHYSFAQHNFAQRGFGHPRLKIIKRMAKKLPNAKKIKYLQINGGGHSADAEDVQVLHKCLISKKCRYFTPQRGLDPKSSALRNRIFQTQSLCTAVLPSTPWLVPVTPACHQESLYLERPQEYSHKQGLHVAEKSQDKTWNTLDIPVRFSGYYVNKTSVGSWVRQTDSQNLNAPNASRSSYLGTNLHSFRNSKS